MTTPYKNQAIPNAVELAAVLAQAVRNSRKLSRYLDGIYFAYPEPPTPGLEAAGLNHILKAIEHQTQAHTALYNAYLAQAQANGIEADEAADLQMYHEKE
jgi:hypothetical protein